MDNDYFVRGMEAAVARLEAAGIVLPPVDHEKYDAEKEEPAGATRVSCLLFKSGCLRESTAADVQQGRERQEDRETGRFEADMAGVKTVDEENDVMGHSRGESIDLSEILKVRSFSSLSNSCY